MQHKSKPGEALARLRKAALAVMEMNKEKKKTQAHSQLMSASRINKLFGRIRNLFLGDFQDFGRAYQDIGRNIWQNDFVEKLMDDQKMYEDLTQSQSWVNNLNSTFGTKVKSLEFYHQAKNMALIPKQIEPKMDGLIENEDSVSVFGENEATQDEMKYGKQLMRKYYVSTLKHLEVPKPQFANILKNVLYVSEERITDGMA